jgi:D-beta-D-heptose 7-phosphate kinase / D-beta-D-heptose 1-phosphate adenosyltransferase
MTSTPSLVSLVERLADARVLCIGDVMLDKFVTGEVERISPEAPIPVLRITDQSSMLGGAGNVVRNITTLGGQVHFVAAVGDDDAGRAVAALIDEHTGVHADLLGERGRETAIKTRFLAGNQQMLRTDQETVTDISDDMAFELMAIAESQIPSCDAVMLSDYGKGVLSNGVLRQLIDTCQDAGLPVIVDPKGTDYSCYRGASLVTPNRKELELATGMPTATDEEVTQAARHLIATTGIKAVLATRSADGMSLITEDHVDHLAAEAREVFDVSGAGDTVAAAMSAALATGANMKDAAALANTAAGIVVGKFGTATVYREELMASLYHQNVSEAEAKVHSDRDTVERIAGWRRQNLSVGFTNGCFDLLHPGHLSLLNQARDNCDRLIVGLNTDASVKRLKGPDRPLQSESARAQVLASLTSVDAVVLFDDETPLRIIEMFLPDVLVKGADYTEDTVVGADVVKQNGGRIVLAKLEDGFSTTATVKRMNGD